MEKPSKSSFNFAGVPPRKKSNGKMNPNPPPTGNNAKRTSKPLLANQSAEEHSRLNEPTFSLENIQPRIQALQNDDETIDTMLYSSTNMELDAYSFSAHPSVTSGGELMLNNLPKQGGLTRSQESPPLKSSSPPIKSASPLFRSSSPPINCLSSPNNFLPSKIEPVSNGSSLTKSHHVNENGDIIDYPSAKSPTLKGASTAQASASGLKITFHTQIEDESLYCQNDTFELQPAASFKEYTHSDVGSNSEAFTFPQPSDELSEYWNEEQNRYYTQREMDEWNAQYSADNFQHTQCDTPSSLYNATPSNAGGVSFASVESQLENTFEEQLYSEQITNNGDFDRSDAGPSGNWTEDTNELGETEDTYNEKMKLNIKKHSPLGEEQMTGYADEQSTDDVNNAIDVGVANIYHARLATDSPIGIGITNLGSQDFLKSMDTLASLTPGLNCWNCIKENVFDANFCINCGSRLKDHVPVKIYDNPIQARHVSDTDTANPIFCDALGRQFGHCFASFGAGGKLIYSLPEKQVVFGISAGGVPASIEKSCPGPLIFGSTSTCLAEYERYCPSPLFGGKLLANEWPKKDSISKELDDLLPNLYGFEALIFILKSLISVDFRTLEMQSRDVIIDSFCPSFEVNSVVNQIEALLLRGLLTEASDLAVSSNLWLLALILSVRVDQNYYANVVSSMIHLADLVTNTDILQLSLPLKALLLVFGGAIHEDDQLVCYLHDWPLVLGLVLANSSKEEDERFFGRFGSLLESNGYLLASHICFLLSPNETDSLLRGKLLGGDNLTYPHTFFKNHVAIHLTEIYESAKMLVNGAWGTSTIPHFQAFKLVYAAYLADIGYPEKCIEYLKSISSICGECTFADPFINEVFSERLVELVGRLSLERPSSDSGAGQVKPNTDQDQFLEGAFEEYENKQYFNEENEQFLGNIPASLIPSSTPIHDSDINYSDLNAPYHHSYTPNYQLELPNHGSSLQNEYEEVAYQQNESTTNQNSDKIDTSPTAALGPPPVNLPSLAIIAPHNNGEEPWKKQMPSIADREEDTDDLGFGNLALKKKDPSPPHDDRNTESVAENRSAMGSSSSKEGMNNQKKGIWSSITSMLPFGTKDKEEGPKKAHLPEGSSFVYDPELKKWVNKKGGPAQEKESVAPPPVIAAKKPESSSLGDSMSRVQSPIMSETAGTEGKTNHKKRSARSKYVDIMNPNPSNPSPTGVAQFLPTTNPTGKAMVMPSFNPEQQIKSHHHHHHQEQFDPPQSSSSDLPAFAHNQNIREITKYNQSPQNIKSSSTQKVKTVGKQGAPPDL